jgi:hypothetical protein
VPFEGAKVSRVEKSGRPVLPQGKEQQQKTPVEGPAPAPAAAADPALPPSPTSAVEQAPPAPEPDGTTN